MTKMLIGLAGPAGSGKDTIADYLVSRRGLVKMANADLLKRVARDVFGFSDAQLWGPSELRNAGDKRFLRAHGPFTEEGRCRCCGCLGEIADFEEGGPCFLTPRFVLQSLGTEWGRACYPTVWVERLLGLAQEVLKKGGRYDAKTGLAAPYDLLGQKPPPPAGIVISDVRFLNEVDAIRAAGGKVVRVSRHAFFESEDGRLGTSPNEVTSVSQASARHASETELLTIPAEKFDYVFQNSGDLHFLRLQAERMMDVFEKKIMPFDPNLQDAPPFLREKCKELARAMQGAAQAFGSCEGAWVDGAEVLLWTDLQAAIERRNDEPDATLSAYESSLMKLKELSDAVNGWFSWQNKAFDAPYFVRRGEWLEEYAKRRA